MGKTGGDRDVAEFGFASEFRLLQVGQKNSSPGVLIFREQIQERQGPTGFGGSVPRELSALRERGGDALALPVI